MPLHAEHSPRILFFNQEKQQVFIELQQVFIDEHLQDTTPILTFKEVVEHYLTHVHP
jgi:hypothetical protein